MIIVSFRYSRQMVKSDDEQRDHPEGDDQLDYDSKLLKDNGDSRGNGNFNKME